jgi:FkbM family methyltransferase
MESHGVKGMPAMVVNTSDLFNRLLEKMHVDVVCDVGSMDGSDALRFRSARPKAEIYAFECNPEKLRQMRVNPQLRERHIHVVPSAASDRDGEADFFLVAADFTCTRRRDACGMGSLHRRDAAQSATVVRVATTRLDTFVREKCSPRARVGLWIDTEGKSFEVVQGTIGIAKQVRVLHLEVETTPCIATGQKLYRQVKRELRQLGFSEVATDKSIDHPQFNAVFVRDSWNLPLLLWLKSYLFRERLHESVTAALRRLQPGGGSRH